MSESADRYGAVATAFTERVVAVPPDRWDRPTPCDGWVARDVLGHLTEWLPAFFVATFELDPVNVPSAADDPVAAWSAVDGAFRSAFADPAVVDRVRSTPMGEMTFAQTVDMICTPDVLVHTWDLARAVGLDERLDPGAVHRLAVALPDMAPMEEAMRSSGQFGPRVDVADDADEQTRVLAFFGRRA